MIFDCRAGNVPRFNFRNLVTLCYFAVLSTCSGNWINLGKASRWLRLRQNYRVGHINPTLRLSLGMQSLTVMIRHVTRIQSCLWNLVKFLGSCSGSIFWQSSRNQQNIYPFMFISKGMEEAVSNWMSVILVHLATCGQNSEPLKQWAVGRAVRHHFLQLVCSECHPVVLRGYCTVGLWCW